MVSNTVGKPVRGDDFFDRERETKHIWSRLETDNVLLLAPRRVGKTSLMFRLRDDARIERFNAVYVDVSDATTELVFIQKLYKTLQELDPAKNAIKQIAKGPLKQFFHRIKKVGVVTVSIELAESAKEHWAELGESLTRALNDMEGRWLLLVDELPIFVLSLLRQDPSANRARNFLHWFRQLRLDPKSSQRVRWLLAGSIGLDTVTRRMKLGDTINDLFVFNDFGAFSPQIADRFLDELGKSYNLPLSTGVKARLCERAGWLIPYHLQLFFAGLREHCSDRGDEPTVQAVDAVYEELLGPGKRSYFEWWEQRLTEELGEPESRYAIDLLNAIAKNPEGEPLTLLKGVLSKHLNDADQRDDKLHYLLDVLQSDGYLVLKEDRYRFRSSLLREFWVRRVAR